jgi:hypothetical protein
VSYAGKSKTLSVTNEHLCLSPAKLLGPSEANAPVMDSDSLIVAKDAVGQDEKEVQSAAL